MINNSNELLCYNVITLDATKVQKETQITYTDSHPDKSHNF